MQSTSSIVRGALGHWADFSDLVWSRFLFDDVITSSIYSSQKVVCDQLNASWSALLASCDSFRTTSLRTMAERRRTLWVRVVAWILSLMCVWNVESRDPPLDRSTLAIFYRSLHGPSWRVRTSRHAQLKPLSQLVVIRSGPIGRIVNLCVAGRGLHVIHRTPL